MTQAYDKSKASWLYWSAHFEEVHKNSSEFLPVYLSLHTMEGRGKETKQRVVESHVLGNSGLEENIARNDGARL